jgi:hypothetical protein
MGALFALIAGNGMLAKTSIVALAALGAIGASLAALEHGWLKAPMPIGTPVRAIIALCFIWGAWALLAIAIWPKHAEMFTGSPESVVPIPKPTTEGTPEPTPKPTKRARGHKAPSSVRPKPEPPKAIENSIAISAMFSDPQAPNISVSNLSDTVAENVIWSMIAIRTSDLSYFGFATQSVGYIKPHTESGHYSLNLANIQKTSDGDGQIKVGDELTGSISVDCPRCEIRTYIVHLVWLKSGWFFEFPEKTGYVVPKDMSKDGRSKYIQLLTGDSYADKRIEILARPQ